MIRRGHWPGANSMAVGKDADAHALAHANVGVRVVGSAVGESSCRARSEHVFDGRCNMATGAGEQRRMVLPLGSSSRDVVEEDFSLGVATIQHRQSQQQQLGLLSAAANTSAFTCVEA